MSRLSCLTVIIIGFVHFCVLTPINCQVGAIFCICYYYAHWSTSIPRPGSLPVGWASLLRSDPDKRAFVSDILSLGIFRLGWLRPKFDINHASHVSFNPSMVSMWWLFPMYVLIERSSFAIWDRSKIITAISAVVWVANLGFQLAGELTSSSPCGPQRIWFDIRCR